MSFAWMSIIPGPTQALARLTLGCCESQKAGNNKNTGRYAGAGTDASAFKTSFGTREVKLAHCDTDAYRSRVTLVLLFTR